MTDIESYEDIDCIEEDHLVKFIKHNKHKYTSRDKYTLMFKIDRFISNNLESYNKLTSKIWKQFILDCPRHNVYINGRIITNKTEFCKCLRMYDQHTILLNKCRHSLVTLLAMLCNQSSYALPLKFLMGLLDSNSGLMIVNSYGERSVKITFDVTNLDGGLTLIASSEFLLVDVNKDAQLVDKFRSSLTVSTLSLSNFDTQLANNGLLSISKV